jgi:hypothetical protein
MVRALAGDSTMTRFLAIAERRGYGGLGRDSRKGERGLI